MGTLEIYADRHWKAIDFSDTLSEEHITALLNSWYENANRLIPDGLKIRITIDKVTSYFTFQDGKVTRARCTLDNIGEFIKTFMLN